MPRGKKKPADETPATDAPTATSAPAEPAAPSKAITLSAEAELTTDPCPKCGISEVYQDGRRKVCAYCRSVLT